VRKLPAAGQQPSKRVRFEDEPIAGLVKFRDELQKEALDKRVARLKLHLADVHAGLQAEVSTLSSCGCVHCAHCARLTEVHRQLALHTVDPIAFCRAHAGDAQATLWGKHVRDDFARLAQPYARRAAPRVPRNVRVRPPVVLFRKEQLNFGQGADQPLRSHPVVQSTLAAVSREFADGQNALARFRPAVDNAAASSPRLHLQRWLVIDPRGSRSVSAVMDTWAEHLAAVAAGKPNAVAQLLAGVVAWPVSCVVTNDDLAALLCVLPHDLDRLQALRTLRDCGERTCLCVDLAVRPPTRSFLAAFATDHARDQAVASLLDR
jgi:hypothetical protein